MRNQPRDVTGGDQMLSALIPGMGLMNYILGWFSVPIEVFLRRDFGERYFTRANFFAGLFVLLGFRFASALLSMLNPLAFLGGGNSEPSESWMGSVIKWYLILGIAHFALIWWKDITGQPEHSYSSGRSWLRPLGKLLMGGINLVLNNLVRLIIRLLPEASKPRLSQALPVLQDVDTFTERFIEPFAVFVFAMICQGAGQTSLFFWLLFSIMALNLSTGIRHRVQRSYVLDIRDQLINVRIINEAMSGRESTGSEPMKQFVRETAREAERTPEIIDIIRQQHPTIAEALAAINPQLKRSMQSSAFTVGNSPAVAA